jgi:hypothetical protein
MAIKTIGSRVVLSNASYLHVTPYTSEDVIGTETFDIVDIVGDTLSFTPDDNNINAKEWEFGDTPLFENITLGKIQFAATCIDFQNAIMKALMGWTISEDETVAYAPSSYKDIYAVVEVGFNNEDVVVVVPKLKLNSKAVISTMKTGTAEGNLAGTAYNAELTVGDAADGVETPMAIIKTGAEGNTSYKVTAGTSEVEFTIGEGKK